jgi:hypothetical protein
MVGTNSLHLIMGRGTSIASFVSFKSPFRSSREPEGGGRDAESDCFDLEKQALLGKESSGLNGWYGWDTSGLGRMVRLSGRKESESDCGPYREKTPSEERDIG